MFESEFQELMLQGFEEAKIGQHKMSSPHVTLIWSSRMYWLAGREQHSIQGYWKMIFLEMIR